MKFFAINGSHRKDGNTAQLLEKALEGIKSVCSDAEIESVNLYDVPFNGCKSCFACKKINGRHYGKCVYKDDFKPILEEIVRADGVILGSPVYFGDVSGVMRMVIHRYMMRKIMSLQVLHVIIMHWFIVVRLFLYIMLR